MTQIRIAYYCSGHGYGHATRVSAFASSLLSLQEKPEIFVVSSAPARVFSECIARGAHYRHVDVDPIIVQPLAYRVDRRRSVEVLQKFLSTKDEKLALEVTWLLSEKVDCVLSDAAFLACEAAKKACIPSILITNFTFDSVYSYLGAEISDCSPALPNSTLQISNHGGSAQDVEGDTPIPLDVLEPLVSQLFTGYCNADILLLLPGFIPIPSFFRSTSLQLPATTWIDPSTNRFRPEIESTLLAFPSAESALNSPIPFPTCGFDATCPDEQNHPHTSREKLGRTVKYAPLLVRPASPNINTREGRKNLLSSIGIPEDLHDPDQTHILLVSFGGQTIRRPYGGKSPSRMHSPFPGQVHSAANDPTCNMSAYDHTRASYPVNIHEESVQCHSSMSSDRPTTTFLRRGSTKIFIPGAPAPANNPVSLQSPHVPYVLRFPLNNDPASSLSIPAQEEQEPSLLPSPSWIAIICGVPTNWSISGEDDDDLPPGFFVAPRDVYMPDLTAVADVLLGKLGYGTVSESVAQSTPFVYGMSAGTSALTILYHNAYSTVPRPLFVEEHGLRLFLEAEGTGVELSREEYESGNWARKVEEAYLKGKGTRHTKDLSTNQKEVEDLAGWVVESVRRWAQRVACRCQ